MELSPKMAETVFAGDGGSYHIWSSTKFPFLSKAKVGAGKLVLQPHGFALPHYADSSKIGYVLQGSGGLVGMVFPNTSKEKVMSLKKGDAVPVPYGVASWWYNSGDSDLTIVFLGETSKAHVPGEFSYFFLTGGQGILSGFSTEIISRAFNIQGEEANKVAKSQTGVLIVKLEEEQTTSMPKPCEDSISNDMVFSIDGGAATCTLIGSKHPILGDIGLSAYFEKLDANGISSPMYNTDSAVQVTYVVRGSGRIQISGINGKVVVDTNVKAGHLFVLPSFFVAAKVADSEGMECFSVVTASCPIIQQVGGKKSVFAALSPGVLQASLNVTPELAQHLSN